MKMMLVMMMKMIMVMMMTVYPILSLRSGLIEKELIRVD